MRRLIFTPSAPDTNYLVSDEAPTDGSAVVCTRGDGAQVPVAETRYLETMGRNTKHDVTANSWVGALSVCLLCGRE